MNVQTALHSHPDKLLIDHLRGVVQISHRFLEEKQIDLLPISDAFMISTINGIAHDLGKATRPFQEYLFADESLKQKMRSNPLTHHGLLSAVCGYYLTKEVFADHQDGDLYALISFLVVRRHHGNLGDIMDETIIDDRDVDILVRQYRMIEENKFRDLCRDLSDLLPSLSLIYDQLEEWISGIQDERLRSRARKQCRQESLAPYFLVNFFYSLLVDADKTDAVVGEDTIAHLSRVQISGSIVDRYKKEERFPPSRLNNLREQAYKEITIRDYTVLEPGAFVINLPTGLGKTLASLSFACKLKQALSTTRGVDYRVIYALPFLSIIDQNYGVVKSVLKLDGLASDSRALLKHHHLATRVYEIGDTDFEPDEAKILIEGWNSEIIVTTFVQLFETLITGKNSMVRKFHRLGNSILILDEVQSIRHELWPLVKQALAFLTNRLKSYVVFVTATDPLIFPREELISLADREKYFRDLKRVHVEVNLKKQTLEEFIDRLSFEPNKTYLFILNTIGSAERFYALLTKKVQEKVVFLSSHVTPKQRLERIGLIKSKDARFVVSTQLVEAGVDVDFNVVYRDVAPMDAINQAAGRCNRNGGDVGLFRVVALVDDNARLYASYIYDPELIAITWDILESTQAYWENEFLQLIDRYYAEVKRRCSFDRAHEYLEALYKLKYEQTEDSGQANSSAINSFRIIESYPKMDVFVALDGEAETVWQKFLATRSIEPLPERRLAFDRIRAEFYQYVIAVPTTVTNVPPQEAGFFYVPRLQLAEYYDCDTGFKSKGINPIW